MEFSRPAQKKKYFYLIVLDLKILKSLFDSFGFEDFKEFIIGNDRNILNKNLFGIEKWIKKSP